MQKRQIKPKVKKKPTLEETKQKYLNATHPQEKAMLLGLIKLQDPKFKG